MSAHAERLLEASVGVRTRAIYKRYIKEYHQVTGPSLQFTEQKLCNFAAELHLRGKSHSTILGYVSALRYHCKIYNLKNDLESTRFAALLKGVKNTVRPLLVSAVCLQSLLERMGRMAMIRFDQYEAILVGATVSLAFYGFLRVGEYTHNTAGHAVCYEGVTCCSGYLVVRIPSSKADKLPITIKVKAMKDRCLCPVVCYKKYKRVRPKVATSQLFLNSDGSTVTATNVTKWLRELGEACGNKKITTHSLRVGGATWAAGAGWSDARIRAHGRWNSNAFLRYIRPV